MKPTYNDAVTKKVRLDDDGHWVTTENGHHVHINEEGAPDKGNPHVIEKMNGAGVERSKGHYVSAVKKKVDSIKERIKTSQGHGPDYEDAVQSLMDLSFDNPENFYEIVDSLDDDTADRLLWEMGPDNTNAISDVINPAIKRKKDELRGKIPPPKKNKSSSAVINGEKIVFSNERNAEYPNASKHRRFIDISVFDPESGEKIGSYAANDYESAMEHVYRIAGLRTKSLLGR